MENSGEIKPIALPVDKLCLAEGISFTAEVSKPVENLLEVFGVTLKELLGLIMPNNYCHTVMKEA